MDESSFSNARITSDINFVNLYIDNIKIKIKIIDNPRLVLDFSQAGMILKMFTANRQELIQ